MPSATKIIFAGLDAAGKTSLILTLQKKFSFLSGLKPTFGLNRSNINEIRLLGLNIVTWDLGGQEKFRQDYFKQKYRVFIGATSVFFLIDLQATARFGEAFDYFRNILQTFDELAENPEIVICFNKFDPDIQKDVLMINRISELTVRLQEINANRFRVNFYNTTIYDPITIIKAFSETVIHDSPKAKIIGDFLKEYAKTTFSSAVLLLDENSLMMGNYSSKPQYIEICEMVAPRFISAMEKMVDYNLTAQGTILNIRFPDENAEEEEEHEALIFIKSIVTTQGMPLHIITLARNKNAYKLSEKYLPELGKQLSELMNTLS